METKLIYKLIPKIMAEVGSIGKKRENPQQHYKFRGIDDVYLALQPVLSKMGVFYAPKVLKQIREERASKSGGILIYTVLEMEFTFFAEDGSFVSTVTVGEAMDSGDKSANKAMSAALKYALLQVFCIPTEEPKDTENDSPEPTSKITPANQSRAPMGRGQERFTPQPPSEAQIKRLFAIAGSAHWTHDQVKEFIMVKYGIDSTKSLTIDQYNEICNLMPTTMLDQAVSEFERTR